MQSILALTIHRHSAEKYQAQQNTGHYLRMAGNGVDAQKFAANPGASLALASMNMAVMEGNAPLQIHHRTSGQP